MKPHLATLHKPSLNMNPKLYNSTPRAVAETEDSTFEDMEQHPGVGWVSYETYKWLADYTARLVEHSNMPCLPADLDNLREANAKLAEENHNLRSTLSKIS